MADITYIILPNVVKERMSLHDNIDDKLIYPEIKDVQNIYLKPILGSTLFNKIINDIANKTLTGDYQTLVDDYIIDCVCHYVMASIAESINYQIWNKGVAALRDDAANNASKLETLALKDKHTQRAEHYADACRRYLVQNAAALFPEYNQFVVGVDTIIPTQQTYTLPISLGQSENTYKRYNPYNGQYE